MQAWLSDEKGTQNLKLQHVAMPKLTPNHLVIKTKAMALNFSDILMIRDQYQIKPTRPFIPGQEIAGIVHQTNKDSRFNVGDHIAGKVDYAGLAEYATIREDMAFKIPDDINFSQAASLPIVYTTSMVALSEIGKLTPNDTILIHAAAGGVGLAALQIASAIGATIIATASSAAKLEFAKQHGAHHLVNYTVDDWHKQVKTITNGQGVNYILDPVGGDITIKSLRCIARDGTLLIVGFASGDIAQLPSHLLLLKRAAAKGVYWNHDHDADMLRRVTKQIISLLKQKKLNPIYNDGYSFDQLPTALDDLQNRKSIGKLILKF